MHFTRIRDLREDKEWKQVDLAKYLHVTQATYSEYESGKIAVPVESLIKLAELYHVSLDYLVGLSNDKGKRNHKSEDS